MLLIINCKLDSTTICTILEALDVHTARGVVMRWAYQLGTSPLPSKDSKIARFPQPTNCTDLCSFVGLVIQLSSCTPNIAGPLTPLRPLLDKKNTISCGSQN